MKLWGLEHNQALRNIFPTIESFAMYDQLIYVLLLVAGFCLVFGYLAKSIIKYPLLIAGAVLIIVFGMLASSNDGFYEQVGAGFHIARDENFRVSDVNMLFSYVAVNASTKPTLLVLGDFFYYGGILLLLIIMSDLALHTFRGFKARNL